MMNFSRVKWDAYWKWVKQLHGCLSSALLHLSIYWPYFHWKFSAFPWMWRRIRRWSHVSPWSHNPILGTVADTNNTVLYFLSVGTATLSAPSWIKPVYRHWITSYCGFCWFWLLTLSFRSSSQLHRDMRDTLKGSHTGFRLFFITC